jgi:hypothetical protein
MPTASSMNGNADRERRLYGRRFHMRERLSKPSARVAVRGGLLADAIVRFIVRFMVRSWSINMNRASAMAVISANHLKTQGVSVIAEALADSPEAMVSVRGKTRFVVMGIEHYHYLRECELAAALAETREDLAAGRFVSDTADEHVARVMRKP